MRASSRRPVRIVVAKTAVAAAIAFAALAAIAALAVVDARGTLAGTFVIPQESAHRVTIDAPIAAARNVTDATGPAFPPTGLGDVPPFTNSVSTAGNLDGVGWSEQLVGFPNFPNGGTVNLFFTGPGSPLNQTFFEPGAKTGFGQSVTAADVNGDGFNDVIIGDPRQTGLGVQEGMIYVHHGTALGVPQLATYTRTGPGDFSYFGYSVSFAGDVNGDGYDDVVVGAPTYTDDQTAEGIACLYLGGPNGLGVFPAWTWRGDAANSWFGFDVSGAGDVNGDGYDDIVVGQPLYANGQPVEGRVQLFFGSASGLQPFSSFEYESDVANAYFGWSVSAAGDANGDGYADWAVGAPSYTNGQTSEGAVYLFPGASIPFFAPPPKIAEGEVPFYNFGIDVCAGGDFNGDGLGDLIGGVPGYSDKFGQVGALEVMLGMYDLAGWPFSGTFSGQTTLGGFGRQVGIGGDVNGDGFSDPLSLDTSGALAPQDGGGGAVTEGGVVNPPQLVTVSGFSLSSIGYAISNDLALGPYSSHCGWSTAADGDVNGDGFDDALVGAPSFDNTGDENGAAQLFYGHADRPGTPPPPPFLAPLPDWMFTTDVDYAHVGTAVAFAGDVNADGYDDVIVGSSGYTNGQALEGAAFVFLGSAGGPSGTPDWKVEGNESGANFGVSVAGAGDVNGDGYADVLVGATGVSHGQANEGAAYLYYGSALGLSHAPARTYEGNVANMLLGARVAGLGDLDGDGSEDFGIGAPGFTSFHPNEGAIFVYRGAPAGPGAVWDIVESDIVDANLGWEFDGAGDVNGDGKGDLVVGMSNISIVFAGAGRVGVFYGSPGGFAVAPDWNLDGAAGDEVGSSVSSAGDVNCDGFSDIVVGAPGHNSGGGRAAVYLGSSIGMRVPPQQPAQIIDAFDGSRLGHSVAGAGDLNGDGYGDFVVGKPSYQLPKGFGDGGAQFALCGVLQPNTIVDRPIDALRPLSTTAIGTGLRSDSPSSYRLHALVRSPAGRTRVRAVVESKPVGAAFNGQGLIASPWAKVPSPSAGHPNVLPANVNVTGLGANTKHHWRARYATRSIWFNPSPWFSPQANGATQGDVRTAGGTPVVDAGTPRGDDRTLALANARPNPASFGSTTAIAYTLPRDGRVRLTLHDASGRLVRRLVDRDERAGANAIAWDLRDRSGTSVAAGVYFARLAFDGETRESKVVVLP